MNVLDHIGPHLARVPSRSSWLAPPTEEFTCMIYESASHMYYMKCNAIRYKSFDDETKYFQENK